MSSEGLKSASTNPTTRKMPVIPKLDLGFLNPVNKQTTETVYSDAPDLPPNTGISSQLPSRKPMYSTKY